MSVSAFNQDILKSLSLLSYIKNKDLTSPVRDVWMWTPNCKTIPNLYLGFCKEDLDTYPLLGLLTASNPQTEIVHDLWL